MIKKNFFYKVETKKAYTLLELSISILVISILITGALSMSVSRAGKKKVEITNQRIEIIYKALGNYLVTNKKLPCPAAFTDKKSVSVNYGVASTSYGNCADTDIDGVYKSTSNSNLVYGMLPVKDLGLSNEMAEDGFGNRFSYVIDKNFTANSVYPYSNIATFGVATSNDIITIKESNGSVASEVTYDAIFAIISHGANKKGGFLPNSSSANNSASDSYELENHPSAFNNSSNPREATFDNIFYSKYGNSDAFDDIVFYKTRNDLVKDFNAFDSVICTSSSVNSNDVTYNGTVMTWPNTAYGRTVESTTSCPAGFTYSVAKPTKKCGAFGIWEEGTIKPCLTAPAGVCSGGDIVISGANILHIFSENGTFVCSNNVSVKLLVVAGGGAGGYSSSGYGAGGGAGGQVIFNSDTYNLTFGQIVSVNVGKGGLPYVGNGLQGGNTILSGAITLEAAGGMGGGASYADSCVVPSSVTNAAGGGAGYCDSASASGGSGTQSGGGSVVGGLNSGGGGGSSANSGSTPTTSTSDGNLGYGAAGTSVALTGFDYGGGGGGGTNSYFNATATDGGGQGGKIGLPNGVAGTNGLGGGGGGARYGKGSKGGNGVVIIYYQPTP